MSKYKYFFQGFLFMFGICSVPFLKNVKPEGKIGQYWDTIAGHIQNACNGEISK
jgi:hypothetical protein